ncbi:hypothetical protein [Nocardia higoensis]|uniref:hypothetical protein n=1 Tax=Nocardia higoensis TaxID=228599 RepID=UPI0012F6BE10|nr:hypothetical protein [Nocardia higoensis]
MLAELARARGYRLVDVLIVDEDTYLPTAYIAERARSVRADALLAPSFEHFGVSGRVLPLVAELVVPRSSHSPIEPECHRETARGQRNRTLWSVLAAAALIVFVVTAWGLWSGPEPPSAPEPAVIVLPDPTVVR